MVDRSPFSPLSTPTTQRPLLGLTILVVEDSRFACDALRLMGMRSGARIRRADCLASARRHLRVYRPSVAMIDMGLPDGSGAELIEELAQASPRIDLLLAMSGDDYNIPVAIASGADAFLAKPLTSLTKFQTTILEGLPKDQRPTGLREVLDPPICPDPAAFRDDLRKAAEALQNKPDEAIVDYVAQFLAGIARNAQDAPLLDAVHAVSRARRAGRKPAQDVALLNGLVKARLSENIWI